MNVTLRCCIPWCQVGLTVDAQRKPEVARLVKLALTSGWKLDGEHGWRCPFCVKPEAETFFELPPEIQKGLSLYDGKGLRKD